MNRLEEFAINLISKNPNVANNPQLQNYISVIRSGDSEKGSEIARNICQSYGITPEEGLKRAKDFFHI